MRDSQFRRFIESCQSRVSYCARVSRYFPDAAAIVRRIVPIRLISLTYSPTWISTLYRPGRGHAFCGGGSVKGMGATQGGVL